MVNSHQISTNIIFHPHYNTTGFQSEFVIVVKCGKINFEEKKNYGNTWVRVIVFNITFNNISVILWPSVLLVEENGVRGEN